MKWPYAIVALLPLAIAARLLDWPPIAVFVTSAIAIIPLSALLGRATEELAAHVGPTIGGFLNATLGNLAELIIATLALRAGLIDLVMSSITGSILGNLLLVLGASAFAGGLKFPVQRFDPHFVGVQASLLVTAVIGLVVPAMFATWHPTHATPNLITLSVWVAALLTLGYVLSLVYSMVTNKAAFAPPRESQAPPDWSMARTTVMLVLSAAAIGVLSEFLVGATEEATKSLGLSHFFVGLVLVPIIGNAAEHSSAILMARKDRMDIAVAIAVGSSVQVALLVAPLLVFFGRAFNQPMTLAFQPFEVAAVALAVLSGTTMMRDAESNWLEGALLLIVYAVLAAAFYVI